MRPLLVLVSCLALLACSSTDTDSSAAATGDASDGRYHPDPSGVHVAEEAACEALREAQENKRMSLNCVGTTRTCPSLLRAEFSTECMEYDQGSVDGCIDYYNKSPSCAELSKRVKDCVVTPYPGTEPAGCP